MLHYIRDRAQGWIAWFIVGLISIPFALWGVNSYLTGASEVVVASVNGTEISQTELQSALQQYRDRMRNVMGEAFDPAEFEGDEAKKTVLNGLIEQQLLRDANNTLNQSITDMFVSQVVRSTAAFQRDGQFDSEYYAMVLGRAGFTPASYEAQLRYDILAQELTQSIELSSFTEPAEIKSFLALAKQRREIAFGAIPIQDFIEQVHVEDNAVRAQYDAHPEMYTAPEQVKVDYISLSVEALADSLTVTDEALKQFYAQNESVFVGAEQRRVSHILIEGEDADTLAAIEAAQDRIAAGEAFADVAQAVSQDSGSASQGGDLGFFAKGVMDPSFEEAAFALTSIGDISEPVKSEFGYHLIELTDIQTPQTQAFSAVRDEVEKRYRQQEAEKLFIDQADVLANVSFESPDSLEPTAEALAVNIQTTPLFTRNGAQTGIATEKKVIEAAFSEDVLNEDLNSAVLELSDTHMVVIHKHQHIPETLLPFESVEPPIRQQLLFDKASQFAQEKGEAILAEIKAGAEADVLIEQWQPAAFYQRDSEGVSSQVLEKAYAMPKPQDSTEYAGFLANNGNYVIVALSAVEEGDVTDTVLAEQAGLKQQLAQLHGNSELQAFMASLREQADIDIKLKNLR
jgi:peptidyl-prolyl cis-trans isomerase D